MKFRDCYKCGKTKVAKVEPEDEQGVEAVEMIKQGFGKHQGEFKCKDCDEDSDYAGDQS